MTNITSSKTVTAEVPKYTCPVTLPAGTGYTLTPADGLSTSVSYGGSFAFVLELDREYSDSSSTVKVNGEVLEPADGRYVISNITTATDVTVEGVGDGPEQNGGIDTVVIIAVAALVLIILASAGYFLFARKQKMRGKAAGNFLIKLLQIISFSSFSQETMDLAE